MVFSVSGNENWFQEANADLNLAGGNGFIGFASNYNNLAPNLSYEKCNIDKSLYTPVGTDIDNDLSAEIFVTSTTSKITVNTLECEVFSEINIIGNKIRAMPVLMNYDEDSKQELVVLTNQTVEWHEYDQDSDNFAMIKQLNYTEELNITNLDYLTCNRVENKCHAYTTQKRNVYEFRPNDNVVTYYVNSSTIGLSYDLLNNDDYSGTANTRTYGNTNIYSVICRGKNGNNLLCNILDTDTGELIAEIDEFVSGQALTDIKITSSYIAKVGNLYRVLISGSFSSISGGNFILVTDLTGTVLLQESYTGNLKNWSNFVVGDYDKDGDNDACYLERASSNLYFTCWDSSFITPTINQTMNTSHMNYSHHIVVADYNSNEDYLGIGTVEGIFYYSTSTGTVALYNTGVASEGKKGYTMTVTSSAGSGSPSLIYTDSTLGFIVINPLVSEQCGNGVCEDFENAFSCPEDCGVNATGLINETGSPCETDADCDSGKCQDGFCTLNMGGEECTKDSDCISGICQNGICTKETYWQLVEQARKDTYGDDDNTKNFISLFIIMGGAIAVIMGVVIGFGSLGAGFILAIIWVYGTAFFFTIVGWLSVFILLGLIIVALLIVVLLIMIGSGGNE
jgi:hypothetical protein